MSNQKLGDFELPLPIVVEASHNSTLAPVKALDGARVRIEFEGLTSDHVIQLFLQRSDGTQVFTAQLQGVGTGTEFVVPKSVIGACIGKTVTLWYEASLGERTMPSHKLDLTVEHIAPADLPAPRLPDVFMEEGTEFLDLRRFSGDARVQLAPWMFIALRQRIWISAIGQRSYPNHETHELVTAFEVTSEQASNGLELVIPRAWLSGLDDISALTLKTFVTFDASPDLETAHELPRTTHLLRVSDTNLLAPTVEQAPEGVLDPDRTPEGATIIIKFDGMKGTDTIIPRWSGTPGNGTPILESRPGSDLGLIKVAVPALAVSANEGKTVEVDYSVLRSGIERPSPATRVTVQRRRYEHRENFDGQPTQLITAGQTIEIATLTIKFIKGGGTAGIMPFSNTKGILEGPAIGMCVNEGTQIPAQCLRVEFKTDYDRISFAWSHHHLPGEIAYFDSSDVLLGTQRFAGFNQGASLHHWVDFSAPPGGRITSMEVTVQDYSFLDFFTMCG